MRRAILVILVLYAFVFNLTTIQPDVYAEESVQLISAVLEGPVLTDRVQKTAMSFTRASAAYMPDGRCISESEPRFHKLAIFNRPEYTITEPYSRTNVVVLAYCDNYFWGAQPWNYADHCLYRSTDAIIWEPVATLEEGMICSLYVTEDGLLLVGTRNPGGVCVWDSNTSSLVRVLTMLSEDPWPKHWSWAEMHGVIYVGEYGLKYGSDNARRIYKSLDGGWNWEVFVDPPPKEGYHIHKVLADPYRSHIYWCHGDPPPHPGGSELFRSTDSGQSWDLLSSVEQPAAGIARSEGVYFGADSNNIGIYRFLNSSKEGEYVCTDLVEGFIWDMREFNNVIYATSLYHHYDPNSVFYPTVLISKDGKHWGNLYQLQPEISGLERFACAIDGTIYGVMEGDMYEASTMFFPEPIVRTGYGVFVEPAVENLLANPCDSSFEECSQVNWQARGAGIIELSSDRAHSGTKSLKISNATTEAMGAISPIIHGEFPAGMVVGATVRVSGWNNIRWLYVQIIDRTNGLSSLHNHARSGVGWLELTIYWQIPQDSTALSVEVGSTSSSVPGDVLYIDSITFVADSVPVSFQMGGKRRTAETLAHSIPFPNYWTDVFCWLSPFIRSVPIDRPKVIKSWTAIYSNSWLQLMLDEEGTFKLIEVSRGRPESLVSLTAPDFLPGSLIWFAVVQDVNEIGLHILCPQGWLHTTGKRTTIDPDMVYFGSTPQGTMQAGGLYSNAYVYSESMSTSQIAQIIYEIAERDSVLGDLDYDGEVTFPDLIKLAQSWLDDYRNPSWYGYADFDLNGAVDFSDLAVLAENWR